MEWYSHSVQQLCGQTVRPRCEDALRSTTPTLSALSGRRVCSHHVWTLSFSFSVCLLPCFCLIPNGGSTAVDSCQDSDLMHHQYRLSIFCSGTQVQHTEPPPRLLQPLVDVFTKLSYKKPVTTCSTSRITLSRTQSTRTSPSCSTKTLLRRTLRSMPFRKLHPVGGPWFDSWFVDFCGALPFPVLPQSRSAPHPQCCCQETWDFSGGDFNMSAFSTVGDVFADPKFSAPSNSFLWVLGALEDSIRDRTGFLFMPKRSYEWRVDSHCCHKFNNADLALGPRDTTVHFPIFSICAPPTSQALTVSRAANKPRRGTWNAKPPSMNVDNAAGNSPNLRHPECLLVPPHPTRRYLTVFLFASQA